jgi:hypothetical protein
VLIKDGSQLSRKRVAPVHSTGKTRDERGMISSDGTASGVALYSKRSYAACM